ncbi:MAG: hypothetical protein ACE15E_24235 [Acidobacteriota bacterium]
MGRVGRNVSGTILFFLVGMLVFAQNGTDDRRSCYLLVEPNRLILGNQLVEAEIERPTGFIRELRNRQLGTSYPVPDQAAWPFGLRIEASDKSQRRAEIRPDGIQQMRHTALRDELSGQLTLKMLYSDLRDNTTGATSGIELTVEISVEPSANFFLIKGRLLNRGSNPVTEFYAWRGAGLSPGNGTPGRLLIPHGVNLPPEEELRKGLTLPSPSIFLPVAWADVSGREGGVGIGYVNRQDVQTAIQVRKGDQFSEVSWTFFDLEPIASRFVVRRHPAVYPLYPGERFETDPWFLVLHVGDWHQTADAYRHLYQSVLDQDCPSWDDTSEQAKKVDLWAGMKTNGWWPWTLESMPAGFRFDIDMPQAMSRLCTQFDARPSQVAVSCMQTQLGSANPLPDFHKCAEYAGGCEAYARMARRLRSESYPAVLSYVYYWSQKPQATTFDPAASAGIPRDDLLQMERVCLDNEATLKAWRDTIVPGIARLNANAVYFDMGSAFGQLCERPEHFHGSHSLGVLTTGFRQINRLVQEFRRQLGPERMLVTEAKDDIRGRHYDVWHGPTSELIRYTHPYRLVALDSQFIGGDEGQAVNRNGVFTKIQDAGELALYALLTGCQLITTPGSLQPGNVGLTRQFARLRRQMREQAAPGYPQGFVDTVGVRTSEPELDARAFRDQTGATVAFCNWGTRPVSGWVSVDTSPLKVPARRPLRHSVKLGPREAGYFILK